MDQVAIGGLRELQQKLTRDVPEAVQGQVLVEALQAGAVPIAAVAEAKSPRRTGFLASEMVVETKEAKRDEAEVEVGPSRDAFYGLFQELKGTPFLRPAFDQEVRNALGEVADHLAFAIEREAR